MARPFWPFDGAVATLTQHSRVHEMLGSILTGVALGLIILLVLSAYPGEPFDYSKPDGGRAEREAVMIAVKGEFEKKDQADGEGDTGKVVVKVAADGCSSSSSSTTTTTTVTSLRHRHSHARSRKDNSTRECHDKNHGQHAQRDALHRLLVQEDRMWQRLQHLPPAFREMLGLSEDGVRLAVRQAAQREGGNKEQRQKQQKQQEGGLGMRDLAARVDLLFYLLAFSALIYVINLEYGQIATRLIARVFSREAAVLGYE